MQNHTSAVHRLQTLGFRFLPVTPDTKRPAPGAGVDSAVLDAEAVVHRTGWYGVVCPVGYVVLDFDMKGGRDGIAEFAATHGDPPPTWTVTTPSGGRHMYYSYPPERGPVGQRPIIPGSVDVRAQRGYVVGPGTPGYILLDEDDAEIAEAPDWLVELLPFAATPRHDEIPAALPHLRVGSPDVIFEAEVWSDLQEALAHISSDDYQTWTTIGLALANVLPAERSRELWLSWSERSPKFELGAARKKWHELQRSTRGEVTYRTIFAMAMDRGWPNASARPTSETFVQVQQDPGYVEACASVAPRRDEFPWHLVNSLLTGPIGDVVEWIQDCNRRPLAIAAFGAAVSAMSGCLARRVFVRESPAAPRIPLQTAVVVVARTGAGKDAPLRAARAILQSAGRRVLPTLPFHMNSIYAALVESQGCLGLILDEVDGALAAVHNRNEHAAGKEAALKTMMTCGPHLDAPPVSPANPQRQAIEQQFGADGWTRGVADPALVFFGVATPNAWVRLAENVAGGLVGRMLVLDAVEDLGPIVTPTAHADTLPATVERWVRILHPCAIPGAFTIGEDVTHVVTLRPETALELARAAAWLTTESNAAFRAGEADRADLLARGIEQVTRLASVLALGAAEDPLTSDGPRPEHVRAALAVVTWAIGRASGETEGRQDQSPLAVAIHDIRQRLAVPTTFGLSAAEREAGETHTHWHYVSRLPRRHIAQLEHALRALERGGELVREGRRVALVAHLPST